MELLLRMGEKQTQICCSSEQVFGIMTLSLKVQVDIYITQVKRFSGTELPEFFLYGLYNFVSKY